MNDNISLSYCDYIASRIKILLSTQDPQGLIHSVGHMQWDLNEDKSFKSTKKTVEVIDMNNKKYRITVEEA